MDIYWYLPTHNDGPYIGTDHRCRPATPEYLTQMASAADQLGYVGVLVPTGNVCEDAWVVASSLIPATKRLKFIIAVRPGHGSPASAARMAASFDRMSGGRLIVNVVCGGNPDELAGDGVFLDHDARYDQASEWIEAWKQLVKGEETTFDGDYVTLKNGKVMYPALQQPHPPLMCGASSAAGQQFAARCINTALTWGEPPEAVAEKITELREAAAAEGTELTFGIRLHIIVRESSDQAWEAAKELIRFVEPETIARAQEVLRKSESEGQKRMVALHNGSMDGLEVSPNLWAGVGLVTGGAGTALVGNPDEVAQRLLEYKVAGIDTFILSGYPNLEECYRVAELLFPKLPFTPEQNALGTRFVPGGW